MKKMLMVMLLAGVLVVVYSYVFAEEAGIEPVPVVLLPEEIILNESAYEKHLKKIVVLSHKKHFEEYGASCGDCHHDQEGKPLELKSGDPVDECISCHTKAGKRPKGKMTSAEKLEWHMEALHKTARIATKNITRKKESKQLLQHAKSAIYKDVIEANLTSPVDLSDQGGFFI